MCERNENKPWAGGQDDVKRYRAAIKDAVQRVRTITKSTPSYVDEEELVAAMERPAKLGRVTVLVAQGEMPASSVHLKKVCDEGECVTPPSCGPGECSGCCDGDKCEPGNGLSIELLKAGGDTFKPNPPDAKYGLQELVVGLEAL